MQSEQDAEPVGIRIVAFEAGRHLEPAEANSEAPCSFTVTNAYQLDYYDPFS